MTRRLGRREFCVALPAVAAAGGAMAQGQTGGVAAPAAAGAVRAPLPEMLEPRVFAFDAMPKRTQPNGAESRDSVRGLTATGEAVRVHETELPVGAAAPALHRIGHTEMICMREGTVEFQREGRPPETVGAGSVIYVALGTVHAVKNVGTVPAKYFVVSVGGDVKG